MLLSTTAGLRGKRAGALAWRLIIAFMLVFTVMGFQADQASAQQQEAPVILARSAVLMDYQTGHVLYSRMGSRSMAPASTTKVITTLLGLELGRPGEIVTVSPYASDTGGTSLELQAGSSFYLLDIIKGTLLNSGNDAASAISEHLAGNEGVFASLMTYKARTIGAVQSNFVNPHGLDHPGHSCTAYDLALITRYALGNQIFKQYVQTRDDVIYERKTRTPVLLSNTNRLLGSDKNGKFNVIGVKTGTTDSAGQCLVAAAEKDGKILISVVLDSSDRYADTRQLLQYGYEGCTWHRFPTDREMFAVPVVRGTMKLVPVGPAEEISFAVNSQEAPLLEKRVKIPARVRAPISSGATIGKIDFYLGDRFLFGTGLKTLTPVSKKSILF
jgi:D-alanyl-D-alanine carboxypeptidase (penicillin-binding protein 5/6)